MNTELRTALLESKLLASEAAAAALASGWRIERLSEPGVISEMFIITYKNRAAHLRKLEGEHCRQLARSTEEFVENLRSAVGTTEECFKISGTEEHFFLLFRSVEGGSILGCMRVLPAGEEAFLRANQPAA